VAGSRFVVSSCRVDRPKNSLREHGFADAWAGEVVDGESGGIVHVTEALASKLDAEIAAGVWAERRERERARLEPESEKAMRYVAMGRIARERKEWEVPF